MKITLDSTKCWMYFPEGNSLGDLSDARIQAATSVSDLAQTYTWVSSFPGSLTGQLGPNLIP